MKKTLILLMAASLCTSMLLCSCMRRTNEPEETQAPDSTETPYETETQPVPEPLTQPVITEAETEAETIPETAAPSTDGPTYIDGILVVNKSYTLPETYNPGIDPSANSALNEMISAAKADGITLFIVSGFRSYNTQATIYNNYVARDGQAEADRYSARPGHSEHQSGLAFDLNSLEQSFGETAEGKWLAANCYKYGFIIRYPHDKEAITGYMYEPWHVRYLGTTVANKVFASGLCLEEYLNIKSVYAN